MEWVDSTRDVFLTDAVMQHPGLNASMNASAHQQFGAATQGARRRPAAPTSKMARFCQETMTSLKAVVN
jgi:hypothetical protein